MKTRFFILGILCMFCIVALSWLANHFLTGNTPQFHNELLSNFQKDNVLMEAIGGYDSYEFSYPSNSLDDDSLRFELVVFGNHKSLICTGFAYKRDNSWVIDHEKIKKTIE
jgi:hypothetical protein